MTHPPAQMRDEEEEKKIDSFIRENERVKKKVTPQNSYRSAFGRFRLVYT